MTEEEYLRFSLGRDPYEAMRPPLREAPPAPNNPLSPMVAIRGVGDMLMGALQDMSMIGDMSHMSPPTQPQPSLIGSTIDSIKDPVGTGKAVIESMMPYSDGGLFNLALAFTPAARSLVKPSVKPSPRPFYDDFPLLTPDDLASLNSNKYTYHVHGTSPDLIPRIHQTGFNINSNTTLPVSPPWNWANKIIDPKQSYPHNRAKAGLIFREPRKGSLDSDTRGSTWMEGYVNFHPSTPMKLPQQNIVGYLSEGNVPLVKSNSFSPANANNVVIRYPDKYLPEMAPVQAPVQREAMRSPMPVPPNIIIVE